MQQLPELLEDADNELPILSRQLQAWHQQSETSRRLETIPGVGLLTASALAAALGEGKDFKHGRQLADYPGLVPRQASSGGKERLPGISKRGDGYLRGLLIHGSRAVIRHIRRRLQAGQPGGNPWVLLARNETYRVSRAA
jgi:transposase